jgi:glyoxylase-like metal-dependent hydrolase (beta-lactamase superfamily II)
MSGNPYVHCIPHKDTATCCYIVSDPETNKCALIDTAINWDQATGRATYEHSDSVIAYTKTQGLEVEWILETHAHADHLSACQYIRSKVGGKTAIGKNITEVQTTINKLMGFEGKNTDGSQWDKLFDDDEVFKLGSVDVKVLYTPGHTPACICYLIGDALFSGDTLFAPDIGTARCDFPGGSANKLYDSCRRIFALPGETRLFIGHDYPGDRREFQAEWSITMQLEFNVMIKEGTTKEEYVDLRNAKDAKLAVPRLIIPSLQVNIEGGRFPTEPESGNAFIKIPVNVL